jgi:hypothetical protein
LQPLYINTMAKHKLSTLLALRERSEKEFKNMVDDMFTKFKTKQGLFKGERKTYQAKEGYNDVPEKRSFVKVASTVNEQLSWLTQHSLEYFKTVFNIEKTNASGLVKAPLVVDGVLFGEYSSLELLRLKGILEGKMRDLYKELPVRSEQVIWKTSEDDEYKARGIVETVLEVSDNKTTEKRTQIVSDPHIKDSPNRPPVTQEISTQVVIGTVTSQQFSGELSMYERASMQVRLEKLLQGVIIALEQANHTETLESDLGEKILKYIHQGNL